LRRSGTRRIACNKPRNNPLGYSDEIVGRVGLKGHGEPKGFKAELFAGHRYHSTTVLRYLKL
jgi:hypothetical protein